MTTQHGGHHPHMPQIALPPQWVMAAAMLAVAVNLRVAMASVPPLVEPISSELHLSNAAVGVLTTLPVLCMGLFAPAAQWLSTRLGAVASVLYAVVCAGVGSLARLWGANVVVLYAATFVLGVGIAVAGALLPRLVKALFPPERSGTITGLYMLAMMGGASASAALAVPLADWLGTWRASLASWSVLALVGALAWAPFTLTAQRHRATAAPTDEHARLPWRHRTALLLAAYLAVQSWLFYSSLAWIPPTFVANGWARRDAGYLLSAFSLAQLTTGLLGPILADRVPDRRRLLVPVALLATAGLVGMWLAPTSAPWLWVVVIGLGQGAAFSLGLVLLVDYAATPAASGRLTAMCFFVSYTLASIGPFAMGAVRDATGSFPAVWMALVALMSVQIALASVLGPTLPKTS
ncbi:MAG: CynX/NimT family MFS transporter [Dermatophilaceae bacterium]